VIYLAPFILLAPIFLIFAGEKISARIRASREAAAAQARRDRINARIRSERNPAVRAAWRFIRDDHLEDA
jgi:hypothetical protein